jgi:pimeloyl-ACP methyl ester carboxylesterase
MERGERLRTREVQANGLRVHLVDQGEGPAVVLLHGFPDTSLLWRHQVPALVAAGYRVVAPDLRGRGGTEAPPRVEDYGLRNVVADVAGLLDALGIQRARAPRWPG